MIFANKVRKYYGTVFSSTRKQSLITSTVKLFSLDKEKALRNETKGFFVKMIIF
jgi:hypothetical protein